MAPFSISIMRMESDLLLVVVIELVYRFTLNSEVEIKLLKFCIYQFL